MFYFFKRNKLYIYFYKHYLIQVSTSVLNEYFMLSPDVILHSIQFLFLRCSLIFNIAVFTVATFI